MNIWTCITTCFVSLMVLVGFVIIFAPREEDKNGKK